VEPDPEPEAVVDGAADLVVVAVVVGATRVGIPSDLTRGGTDAGVSVLSCFTFRSKYRSRSRSRCPFEFC
jgi:hypothetical protein